MTDTVKRLLLFLIMMPFLTFLILFLPHYKNIAVIILIAIVGFLCGQEMRTILSKTEKKLPSWTVLIPTLAAPLAWLVNMGWMPEQIPPLLMILVVLWSFIDAVFAREEELKSGITRMGSRLLMIVYPGWMLWWVARLTWFDHAGFVMFIFMLTVYLSDATAWLFGILLGRHRNIFAVSPNKSVEGFLGGTLASVVVILISARLRPDILSHPVWQLIIFGIVAAFTTIMGDLVESALKRAVGVKDSGHIFPGRGGMLDSVDSTLLTAPIFVWFLQLAV